VFATGRGGEGFGLGGPAITQVWGGYFLDHLGPAPVRAPARGARIRKDKNTGLKSLSGLGQGMRPGAVFFGAPEAS